MGASAWTTRPLTAPPGQATATWQEEPGDAAALPGLRGRLRATLHDGVLPAGADDGDRLLLVVEELVSNALRHGRPPVHVTVGGSALGWLVVVSDTAVERPPIPALDRDPAQGGMGLALVARISLAHGWAVEGDRKTVWARVPYFEHVPSRRREGAIRRARTLAALLRQSATRTATTMDLLASEADADGRTQAASSYRRGATLARRQAERIGGRSSETP